MYYKYHLTIPRNIMLASIKKQRTSHKRANIMNLFLNIILISTMLFVINGAKPKPLVTHKQFDNAVTSNGYPKPTKKQYKYFVQGLLKGLITTKQEAAMALAEFLHESDGLRATREYMCKDNGCPGHYENPGCDKPGERYYGRGYIQLSWCENYRMVSQDLYKDDRLVNNPDSVAKIRLAWNSAFSFWKLRVHNQAGVSEGNFGAATKAINGGLECDQASGHSKAKRRYAMYGKVRAAFGLSGSGKEQGCYN